MTSNVDYQRLVPVEQMAGEDDEETVELQAFLRDAKLYLEGFQWCHSIRRELYGLGVGGVLGVFLFEITGDAGTDDALWVVCGDLPSAYLVTDAAPTASAALQVYCELMDEWIAAVRGTGMLRDVFPVEAEPTEANAELLEKRLTFLRQHVIPALE